MALATNPGSAIVMRDMLGRIAGQSIGELIAQAFEKVGKEGGEINSWGLSVMRA